MDDHEYSLCIHGITVRDTYVESRSRRERPAEQPPRQALGDQHR